MVRTINYPNGIFDDCVRAGDDVAWELTDTEEDGTTPVDDTGRTATLHVRASADSEDELLELTSPSGGIVLGGETGVISVSMTAAQTRAIGPGTWLWALKLGGSAEETLFTGTLQVLPEVVRV